MFLWKLSYKNEESKPAEINEFFKQEEEAMKQFDAYQQKGLQSGHKFRLSLTQIEVENFNTGEIFVHKAIKEISQVKEFLHGYGSSDEDND
jgi:hypothetical protein